MFKTEWQQLIHQHGMCFVLIAIALIPAIYCWLYLSSMWNTYGKMANVPVAVVNHDITQNYNGRTIKIGHNLVQALNRSDSLDYQDVNRRTAATGLKNGKYYMIITIPSDFSKNATTLLSTHPQQLHLYYRISSGRNYIVSKMTTGAATAIKNRVATQVTKMYATILLGTLHQVTHGMSAASRGNLALATGSNQLQAGVNKLSVGAQHLNSDLIAFQAKRPINATTQLTKQGFAQLTAGMTQLEHGLNTESTGLTQVATGNTTLATNLITSAHRLATINDRTANINALATPIRSTVTDEAAVPNNGTGMAPFAIAVGLFVGGIALGTMYDAETPSKKPRHFLTWWTSKMSIVGSVGVLQALLLDGSLNHVVNLTAKSPSSLFWLLLLGSLTFLSIIFCLRILLGGFGTWLITIILVLQLSASSGLYPVQLTSSFASNLTPYLPMTYLIDGLRHAISLGGSISTDIMVMLLIILGTQALIAIKFFIAIQTSKFDFIPESDSQAAPAHRH
ncbi:YhgE/Pip family protein [Lactiplantibacillus paraplantarum]|uniref:YhgE/Pip family protein n=1 Tax=Lactiplantibacillus paraplantarum TaxID=60520 RepID=UPI0007E2F799|nr:YhgE/Pip family protein [Lactiplantibacillus paraplantarum]MCW1910187.1 YhgE/Pip family protein [Lactiplantibacillus paraplantarum]RDG12800.1 DUF3533 domain-containing protein [Lactiplantibacillus paraplantarum]